MIAIIFRNKFTEKENHSDLRKQAKDPWRIHRRRFPTIHRWRTTAADPAPNNQTPTETWLY